MTRDGAVEDNLTEGTSERISSRLEEGQLLKPRETDVDLTAVLSERHGRAQGRPEEEDASVLPDGSTSPLPLHIEGQHSTSASVGSILAHTAVTDAVRKAKPVEGAVADIQLDPSASTGGESVGNVTSRKYSGLSVALMRCMSGWIKQGINFLPRKSSRRSGLSTKKPAR